MLITLKFDLKNLSLLTVFQYESMIYTVYTMSQKGCQCYCFDSLGKTFADFKF